jgi:NADPH:quinone reductase-like Zn-dependent oxidoreductase
MKAAVYRKYEPPDVVQIEDVQKPVPKDNEVLVKVRAASVNPLDWKVMSGGPYAIRKLLGLGKPKIRRPGVDVAGWVESVGRKVTQFKPSDEVFGTCRGAFAEYVCSSESRAVMKSVLVAKPENVTLSKRLRHPSRRSPHCRDFATRVHKRKEVERHRSDHRNAGPESLSAVP